MRVLLQRWAYFVLGGAVFTPYALLALLAVPLAEPTHWVDDHGGVQVVVLSLLTLVLLIATSLIPLVRTFEGLAVPAMLGGHAAGLAVTPARTPGSRLRGTIWFLGHTIGGAAISLATILGVPVSVLLLTGVWQSGSRISIRLPATTVERGWAVPIALAILVGLVVVVVVSGRTAAWLAPVLLGPDPVARMEELERSTSALAERNRLAQELHDSMGHALTVTALQASAARKVLGTDPTFAAQALDAIARTSRLAAADLDNVLGILRNDAAARTPQPTLRDLDALVTDHRDAGLPLTVEIDGDLAGLAGPVSREVYRIVQEGLTNVARHAGKVPTTLRLSVRDGQLSAQVRNASSRPSHHAPTGGRGLAGIRERVALLGGEFTAGSSGDDWLLDVRVPTGATP